MGCAFAEALPMGDEEWRFCRRRGAPVREGVECPHYRGRGAGGEFVASGDEQAAEAAAGSRLR